MSEDLLPGFRGVDVDVDGVLIHAAVGGEGPPLLLLHGFPQSHVMWHAVAPRLAATHTVVASDLRGYGASAKPAAGPDHAAYSKRAMAADQVALMRSLGHERFAAVGHDRGARVLHRMCLDRPDAITRAAVIDIAPTRHMFASVDLAFGLAYSHWFFLAQDRDLPERMILGDPDHYLLTKIHAWAAPSPTSPFDARAVAAYLEVFRQPEAVAAMCEDYRAAATIDLVHDDADAEAGRRVSCPLLVLWGARGFVARQYDVLAVWRDYADDVRGHPIDSGHFVPEEAPADTVRALADFLGG